MKRRVPAGLLLGFALVVALLLGRSGDVAFAASPTPAPAPAPVPTSSATPTPTDAPAATPGAGGDDASTLGTTTSGHVSKIIDDWFGSIVSSGVKWTTNQMGEWALQSPDVTQLSVIRSDWSTLAYLAGSLFGFVLALIAVIAMTKDTVQSRYGLKEMLPSALRGFIGAIWSLAIVAAGIVASNGLANALISGSDVVGQSSQSLSATVTDMVNNGNIFVIIIGLVLVLVALVAVVEGFLRIVALCVVAVAGPLAVLCHALTWTDLIARLWWRVLAACLVIPVGQALLFWLGTTFLSDRPDQQALFHAGAGSDALSLLLALVLYLLIAAAPVIAYRMVFEGAVGRYRPVAAERMVADTASTLVMRRGN
jgi:hypothetical protein